MVGTSTYIHFEETSYGIVKRVEVVTSWVEQVRQRLAKSQLSILDYGCGTGDYLTFPLASMGHTVVGVDSHEPSIWEARKRHVFPTLSFQSGSLGDLLKENRRFDLIICSEVLEHLQAPSEFLSDLHRLLGLGGTLIVTTPNGYGSYELLCRLERGLRMVGIHQLVRSVVRAGRSLMRKRSKTQSGSDGIQAFPTSQTAGFLNAESIHVQFFRLQVLEQLFRKSGFRIVSRRARTFLCGPYVDVLFNICPFRQTLFRINCRLADLLPFAWAADWMFLLEPDTHAQS